MIPDQSATKDASVIEVGLGGRLDSTNVVTPELAIITNIALDHADYLGSTIPAIAGEKAGIIKPGVPLLTAEPDSGVLALFLARANALRAPMYALRPEDVRNVSFDLSGTSFNTMCSPMRTELLDCSAATSRISSASGCAPSAVANGAS